MDKKKALEVVLDFVERWNKQDKEKEVAEAVAFLQKSKEDKPDWEETSDEIEN